MGTGSAVRGSCARARVSDMHVVFSMTIVYISGVCHSILKFQPREEKKYDMWLCLDYWQKLGWKSPLFNDLRKEKEVGLCSVQCVSKKHDPGDRYYCTAKALHTSSKLYPKRTRRNMIFFNVAQLRRP